MNVIERSDNLIVTREALPLILNYSIQLKQNTLDWTIL